jgi:alpha-N-arabinofuranosidase
VIVLRPTRRRARLAASLLLAALAPPDRAVAVNLTVDATRMVRTVDERIFGANMVIWDREGSTPQTINLLQAAGLRALRFPGGSLSDTYVWSENKSYDTTTGQLNTWSWFTSFDQFANVVTSLNPRPQVFITVNYGSGTPQLAADWVSNANITKALGIKYWEIGNECFGTWEYDTHTVTHDPYTYACAARDYIQQMKAVDPTIKVGVVVTTGEDAYANNTSHPATNPRTHLPHNGWTPVLLATLSSLGVTPDFAIYHRYEQTPGQESDATLLQAARTWPADATDLRQQLTDYLGEAGSSVELVVTENNSVYGDPGKQTTSLVNGLFLADSIGHVLQTEFNAYVWWALRNGPPTGSNGSLLGNQSASLYGWRQYGDYGMLSIPSSFGATTYYETYPAYYMMKLLAHFARGGDTVVPATSDSTLLSIYAVRRVDGSLSLLVLNKSPSATLTATIALTGFTPQATATTHVYGIPQDDAARTRLGSPDLATSSLGNVRSGLTVAFAPYSATVLSLPPAANGIAVQAVSRTVIPGQSATFSLTVGPGPAPTYQWQRQASGSTTWTNLTDNATYSGSATAALTVNSVTAAMNGDSFQCVITSGDSSVLSASAALIVVTPLTVSTLAGQAGATGSGDGTGTAARFFGPADVAMDSAGSVYVADTDNHTIRRISAAGAVTTLAGLAGTSGSANGSGTAARFSGPSGIVADSAGDLYVADTLNHTIRKVTSSGAVSTIAGSAGTSGSDDGIGAAARFHGPQGLALDGAGNLYVADTNNSTIRKIVLSTGAVSTIAGEAGTSGSTDGAGTSARFFYPSGVAVDRAGNLCVADTENSTIREVTPAGIVITVAGQGGASGSADGVGVAARFQFPAGLAVSDADDLYVADTSNHTVRLGIFPTAPVITAQPQGQTAMAGSNAQFSVTASGKPAPTYQWYFNGTAISGATGGTFSLTNAQAANAGNYTVTVTNSAGSVTSNAAALTVNAAPATGGSSSGGGGGGGGAMGAWFVLALVSLLHGSWFARAVRRQMGR